MKVRISKSSLLSKPKICQNYLADENRFGTKMLEKMGWTKGNGLGAKQDGEKDFVRIRFKNDAEGLGFEARDDQWTTHEEGFNGLLKSLNGEETEANGKESEAEEEARPMGFGFKAEEPEEPSKKKLKEKISGISLEEKSKQSRARVHYKKFTRGKDLSQYSEKDLANIFGKKATDDFEAPEAVVVEQPQEEKEVDANFAGVQTVSTGLSVSDYFKQKMEAMKNRMKKGGESTSTKNPEDTEAQANGHDEKFEDTLTENDQEPSKKKKKKKDKERTVEPPVEEEEVEQTAAKLKKNKKSKPSSQDEAEQSEEKLVESEESNPLKRKKKKKDKQEEITEDTIEIIEEPASKKKKSNKKEETAKKEIEAVEQTEEPVPKKKKKSKKVELLDSEVIIIEDDLPQDKESEASDEKTSKKKSKSKKNEDAHVTHSENTIEITEETSTKKKKKKNKSINSVEPAPELLIPALAVAVEAEVKDVSADDEDPPNDLLSLDEINEKLKTFNTFQISKFCADKFQLFDMSAFINSTLSEIVGYASSDNIELEVIDNDTDKQRILDLWSNKSLKESRQKFQHIRYPRTVKKNTIRAVKKRVAFQGI
nr:PIN2/TERF1-interacting telomerase inhibitor 1 isoform X1 [Drosophila takahashii]